MPAKRDSLDFELKQTWHGFSRKALRGNFRACRKRVDAGRIFAVCPRRFSNYLP